jgi:hypothetical protein
MFVSFGAAAPFLATASYKLEKESAANTLEK